MKSKKKLLFAAIAACIIAACAASFAGCDILWDDVVGTSADVNYAYAL